MTPHTNPAPSASPLLGAGTTGGGLSFGSPSPVFYRRFRLADFSPAQQRILLSLRGACDGRPRSTAEIAAAVYGDREDGGPVAWDDCIRHQIHTLRRRLVGTPVAILSRCARGYWLGGAAACDRITTTSEEPQCA